MTATPFAQQDWGVELHRQVMAKLTDLIDDEEYGEHEIDTPSGYPFCGCLDCVVREVLTMGFERFEQVSEP